MSDALQLALAAILGVLTLWIKQSMQHANNKAEIASLKALACIRAPNCKDFLPIVDPKV